MDKSESRKKYRTSRNGKRIENFDVSVDVSAEDIFSNYGYIPTSTELKSILARLMTLTDSELVELSKKERSPFWFKLLVNKAAKDMKEGRLDLVTFMFDRVCGRPVNMVVAQTIDGKLDDKELLSEQVDKTITGIIIK